MRAVAARIWSAARDRQRQRRLAGLFFLFGVGCSGVAAIVAGAAPWVISGVTALGLALYLWEWASRPFDAGPWAGAALGAAAFPLLEALCVWLGKRYGRSTWCYAPGVLRGWEEALGVPAWLFFLWACAGAFVVALHDGLADVASAAFGRDASLCRRSARASAMLFACFGAAAAAAVWLIVWAPPLGTAAGLAAMATTALAAVGSWPSWPSLVAPLATCAAVSAVFPLLESLCCMTSKAWAYHPDAGLLPGINVPVWLFPLWTIIALAFVQAGAAGRALQATHA